MLKHTGMPLWVMNSNQGKLIKEQEEEETRQVL